MCHLEKFNPFAKVVVRNTDADEAGDYRVARRLAIWFGRWRGWEVMPFPPSDLD